MWNTDYTQLNYLLEEMKENLDSIDLTNDDRGPCITSIKSVLKMIDERDEERKKEL